MLFQGLEYKFHGLEHKFQDLEHKFQGLVQKIILREKRFCPKEKKIFC